MYFKLDVNVRASFVRAWLEVWGGGDIAKVDPAALDIKLMTTSTFAYVKMFT